MSALRRRLTGALAVAISGPLGRGLAFATDFAAALGRGVRSRLG